VILPVHPAFGETEDVPSKIQLQILKFCKQPKSRSEIFEKVGLQNHTANYKKYIISLVEKGLLIPTMPDKPTSPKQKYYTSEERKRDIAPA
jgi:ATP-dependent DNA helicase RecG